MFDLFYESSSVWKQDEITACCGGKYDAGIFVAIVIKREKTQHVEIYDIHVTIFLILQKQKVTEGSLIQACSQVFGLSSPKLIWHHSKPQLVALMSTESIAFFR